MCAVDLGFYTTQGYRLSPMQFVFESFQLVSALQYMEQSSHLLASAPAWRECLWFVLGAVCFIPFHETDVIVCTGINCLSFKCFRYCWSKLHLIYFEYHASFGVSQKTRLARLHDAVRQSCMSLRTFFYWGPICFSYEAACRSYIWVKARVEKPMAA